MDQKRDCSAAARKKVDKYSYNLNDRIGKGYSSCVYRGRNDLTSEPIALKVIELKGLRDEVARDMLDSEISILRSIRHPNVLSCMDVLKTTNHCYIITELCSEGDLASLIKRKGQLPEEEALAVFRQVLAGFAQITRHNILHRDLKPANVFISKGVYKIADFGFAKKNTTPGQRQKYNVGSPLYMSPESLKRNIYSSKNDIWSLGIILFEMLYGKTPWDCRSERQLIDKISRVPVAFPSYPFVSDDTKLVIRKCLEVDEADRINCGELVELPALKPKAEFREAIHPVQSIRVLGERGMNTRQREKSCDPYSLKVGASVTERPVREDKENNKKQVVSKEVAIERINVCRLIFKLKEELGEDSFLAPQLRMQLIKGITELRREEHSDKVKKVVEEYYNKYLAAVMGKPQFPVEDYEERATASLGELGGWARELLVNYLLLKGGAKEGIGEVLDKKKQGSLEQHRERLLAAGIKA